MVVDALAAGHGASIRAGPGPFRGHPEAVESGPVVEFSSRIVEML